MKIREADLSAHFHQDHFRKLDETRSTGCVWPASRIPRNWSERVGAEVSVRNALPIVQFDREKLKAFCANGDHSPELCFASVMAWGGMKYLHGRKIWQYRQTWVNLVAQLRTGKISRADAYAAFAQFRTDNPGCGMGPAYFTKLIFFCHPRHDGYIMDQWTSFGVNLLFSARGEPVVDMVTTEFRGVRTDTVSDRNTPETYETFCQCIEELAGRLGVEKAEVVEEWLFSKGGRNPGPWRKHVKEHRPLRRK